MPRCARRIAAPFLVWIPLAWAVGCASAPADPTGAIHDYAMRERVAAVEVGQTLDEAHAILGDAPVRRPGHPERPFPSPRSALTLTARDGASVRVEVYVVATRPAEGCPDVHFEDVPIAFVDGVVEGKGWGHLERRWRTWGGGLQALRSAQERRRCEPWTAAR
jgi:hypothetical protein